MVEIKRTSCAFDFILHMSMLPNIGKHVTADTSNGKDILLHVKYLCEKFGPTERRTIYLYKLGASAADECPPNIHTLPTTNHTAKKQSSAILKYSTITLSLKKPKSNISFVKQIM